MAEHRIVIDTDGGVDDAAALWWLLEQPDVEVVAIVTTAGNVDVDVATGNVHRILHAAGRTGIPVARGAATPVGPAPLTGRASFVHGEDGLGGCARRWPRGDVATVSEPGSELLARLVAEQPGELDLVCIGPLSTLARALEAETGIAGDLRTLTVMGGVVRRHGNALPLGEANIGHDPEAAAAVGARPWAAPPVLVGLDVTMVATLHDDDLELAREGRTSAACFLADPLAVYADFYRRAGSMPDGAFPCHDLVAAMVAVDPSLLVDAPVVSVGIDVGRSAAWGATVADLRPSPQSTPDGFHPWRIALAVDADRVRSAFRTLCGDG